jgi:hypothetical protein
LKVRRFTLLVDVIAYAVALGGVGFLIVANEINFYEWNFLLLDFSVVLLMGTVTVAAWITERKKMVRVYFGTRHLIFVHDEMETGVEPDRI